MKEKREGRTINLDAKTWEFYRKLAVETRIDHVATKVRHILEDFESGKLVYKDQK